MGAQPTTRARHRIIRTASRAPAARAATHMSPVGPAPRENAATPIAATSGTSLRVAMDRSTSDQVSSAPRAITGSGRRPLLKAIQKPRKSAAPVHRGRCHVRASRPRRGTTSRLMMSHDRMPHRRVGSLIHGLAVEISANRRRIS